MLTVPTLEGVEVAISNVEMEPSLPSPAYANAYVSESTCTRELYSFVVLILVSCSKLFPSDCVFTAVIAPSLSIVNVEIKPSLSVP